MPDRVALEVVAEREVAEHLEERMVAGRRPDVLEIVVLSADAHALLARRRTGVLAPLFAEEHVLELVHPGVGEEQRRVVVRHERRAGHDAMAVPLEILQKRRANLSPGHVCRHHFTVTTKARRHDELRTWLEATMSLQTTNVSARSRMLPRTPRCGKALTNEIGDQLLTLLGIFQPIGLCLADRRSIAVVG